MLDESLCTLEDARDAHQTGAAELVNLRLSKCGGLLETARIAAFARSVGIGYQVGTMVGETGILASLGRSFTARVEGVRYLEAAVPTILLESDVTNAQFDLELETRLSRVPNGPGFGAVVDRDVVARYGVAQAII
jgi:muconate cycloisomerase